MNSSTDNVFPSQFPVLIRSDYFKQVLLRMAGVENPSFQGSGFGTVNCQFEQADPQQNPWEQFSAIRNTDGTVSFESLAFPSNFLRMAGVENPSFNGSGFGTVNCQASIGPYEKFRINVLSQAANGVQVAIESNQFASNFLRMDGGSNPHFQGSGFGTVNCQATVGAYETLHLGALLDDSVATLVQWFYPDNPPTQAQIDQLITAIITGTTPPAPQHEAWEFLQLQDHEQASLDAIDLDSISPCVLAIGTTCIDVLLLLLSLLGIRIIRTDNMIQAAVQALGNNIAGLEVIITAISKASTVAKQAVLVFNLLGQFANITFLKGVIKSIVNGFSWWTAAIVAVTFIAQVAAWIATGGALLIAQYVLIGAAAAAIVADAVSVAIKCSSGECELQPGLA
jgi:hypothetical protein